MFGVTPTGNQFSHYLKRRNYKADCPGQRYSIKICSGPLWFSQHKVCLHKQMPVLNRKHLHILKCAGSLSNYLMALGVARCFRSGCGGVIITSKWSVLFFFFFLLGWGFECCPTPARWGQTDKVKVSRGFVAAVQWAYICVALTATTCAGGVGGNVISFDCITTPPTHTLSV